MVAAAEGRILQPTEHGGDVLHGGRGQQGGVTQVKLLHVRTVLTQLVYV